MSTPKPSPACQEALSRLHLDVRPFQSALAATGRPLDLNDPAEMLGQITGLLLAERAARERALTHLATQYDVLRNEYAAAQSKLHEAQTPVARAATQYRDVKLAKLARDVLTGRPRREALDRLPTATQELRRSALPQKATDSGETLLPSSGILLQSEYHS